MTFLNDTQKTPQKDIQENTPKEGPQNIPEGAVVE